MAPTILRGTSFIKCPHCTYRNVISAVLCVGCDLKLKEINSSLEHKFSSSFAADATIALANDKPIHTCHTIGNTTHMISASTTNPAENDSDSQHTICAEFLELKNTSCKANRLQIILEKTNKLTDEISDSVAHLSSTSNNPRMLRDSTVLRDYQQGGVQWMLELHKRGLNGILADEMGLGKTLQVIAFLCALHERLSVSGPHLVVVPLSVLSSWSSDLVKFVRNDPRLLSVYVHHGEKVARESAFGLWLAGVRKGTLQSRGALRLVLTTYDMAMADEHLFRQLNRTTTPWQYLVVDEAHRLKNRSSVLYAALHNLRTQHRLLLTGTPLQNNLGELWALLSFILPSLFDDEQQFADWFDVPFSDVTSDGPTNSFAVDSVSSLPSGVVGAENGAVSALHSILRPFLLRRVKTDVAPDLPAKFERVVLCPLSDMQTQLHQKFREVLHRRYNAKTNRMDALGDEEVDALSAEMHQLQKPLSNFHNILMQLRKLCNHPFLILEEMRSIPDELYARDLVPLSGKLAVLDKILDHLLLETRSKVLIFCQMTAMLTILEGYLQGRGVRCARLDGDTSHDDRERQLREFNSEAGPEVFLLSTRAGGVGINLQAASTVVLFDSDWNPQQDLQAISRAHRIGQTRDVLVLRLISAASDSSTSLTVEQRVLHRATKKLDAGRLILANGIFGMGTVASNSEGSGDIGLDFDQRDDTECGERLLGAHSAFPSLRSLFDENDMCSDDGATSTDNSSVCGSATSSNTDTSVVTVHDSRDFSSRGIRQICRRQVEPLETEICNGPPISAIDRDGVSADWIPWLGQSVASPPDGSIPSTDDALDRLLETRLSANAEASAHNSAHSTNRRKRKTKPHRPMLSEPDFWLLEDTAIPPPAEASAANDYDSAYEEPPESARSSPNKSPRRRGRRAQAVTLLQEDDICTLCDRAWVTDPDVRRALLRIESQQRSHSGEEEASSVPSAAELQRTMLLCDGCDSSYHMICVGLHRVPQSDWFCQWCSAL